MSRRLLPFAIIGLVGATTLGVTTIGVAVAGSRALRGPMFHHMHGDRADHQAHAKAMIQDLLGEVGATAEQSAQVGSILDGAHTELELLHGGLEDHHDQLKAVFTAETVDAAAVEELRLEGLEGFDQATRIFSGVLLDVSAVLDAEQRAELVALAEELHGD